MSVTWTKTPNGTDAVTREVEPPSHSTAVSQDQVSAEPTMGGLRMGSPAGDIVSAYTAMCAGGYSRTCTTVPGTGLGEHRYSRWR